MTEAIVQEKYGGKVFLFLNTFFLLLFLSGYVYVPLQTYLTVEVVYIVFAGIIASAFFCFTNLDDRVSITLIAFAMINVNDMIYGIIIRDTAYVITVFTAKMVFYSIPMLYVMMMNLYSRKRKTFILMAFLLMYLITAYNTSKGLDINPYASRLLAGFATDEQVARYTVMGIGGFGYVYAAIFIIPVVLYCAYKIQNFWVRLIATLVCSYEILVIIKANYTIAVILLAALLIGIFIYRNDPVSIVALILVLLVVGAAFLLFGTYLLEEISRLAYKYDQATLAFKFDVLRKAIGGEGLTSLRRMELYKISSDTIFKYPLIGGMWFRDADYGQHSGLLDYIAKFGLNSIWLAIYLGKTFAYQKSTIKDQRLKAAMGLVQVVFIINILLNMFSIYVTMSMGMFLVAPLCLHLTDEYLSEREAVDV